MKAYAVTWDENTLEVHRWGCADVARKARRSIHSVTIDRIVAESPKHAAQIWDQDSLGWADEARPFPCCEQAEEAAS